MGLKHLKGFVHYTPVSPLPEDFPMENIGDPNIEYECRRHFLAETAKTSADNGMKPLFVHDENGACWYDLMHEFEPDTLKIVYCAQTGRVISFNKDAQKIFPHTDNVIEVKNVPEGFEANTWKVTLDGTLEVYDEEVYAGNKLKQTRLLQWAGAHLLVLQIMQDRSELETSEMLAIQNYMIEVKRVDLFRQKIEWPGSPV